MVAFLLPLRGERCHKPALSPWRRPCRLPTSVPATRPVSPRTAPAGGISARRGRSARASRPPCAPTKPSTSTAGEGQPAAAASSPSSVAATAPSFSAPSRSCSVLEPADEPVVSPCRDTAGQRSPPHSAAAWRAAGWREVRPAPAARCRRRAASAASACGSARSARSRPADVASSVLFGLAERRLPRLAAGETRQFDPQPAEFGACQIGAQLGVAGDAGAARRRQQALQLLLGRKGASATAAPVSVTNTSQSRVGAQPCRPAPSGRRRPHRPPGSAPRGGTP